MAFQPRGDAWQAYYEQGVAARYEQNNEGRRAVRKGPRDQISLGWGLPTPPHQARAPMRDHLGHDMLLPALLPRAHAQEVPGQPPHRQQPHQPPHRHRPQQRQAPQVPHQLQGYGRLPQAEYALPAAVLAHPEPAAPPAAPGMAGHRRAKSDEITPKITGDHPAIPLRRRRDRDSPSYGAPRGYVGPSALPEPAAPEPAPMLSTEEQREHDAMANALRRELDSTSIHMTVLEGRRAKLMQRLAAMGEPMRVASPIET